MEQIEREWLQPGYEPKPGDIVMASRERPLLAMVVGRSKHTLGAAHRSHYWNLLHDGRASQRFHCHVSDMRIATEDERQQFFDTININV